jgi:hypothetical protein
LERQRRVLKADLGRIDKRLATSIAAVLIADSMSVSLERAEELARGAIERGDLDLRSLTAWDDPWEVPLPTRPGAGRLIARRGAGRKPV